MLHARNDCDSGFYNWACFSAQQAAEKALKAVFQKTGAEIWGRSVSGLLRELTSKFEAPTGLFEACQELDKAYIPTRYPNALPAGSPSQAYNRGEAERMIGHAERVVVFCKGLLS